jgi:hypothetical protein
MENYRVYYDEDHRKAVLKILNRTNDILINNIMKDSVGITIERDNAEVLYKEITDQINKEVYQDQQNVTLPF